MIQRMGLNNLDNESALNINGLEAYTGVSVVNSSEGPRPTRFTVIYFNQRAYIVAGASKIAKDLGKYDQTILDTAKSFHALTENEKVLAKPLRLKVVQASNETHFSDLAKQSSLESHAESQLRLLNAKYPDGEPQKGELLKIIE